MRSLELAFYGNHLHHAHATSSVQNDGLWLIGVGALIAVVASFIQGEDRGLGGRPVGREGTRKDNFAFAVLVIGGLLVATGSVILAIEKMPAGWVIAVTAGGVIVLVAVSYLVAKRL